MKRTSGGEKPIETKSAIAQHSLQPMPLVRTHLFEEPILALIAITSTGIPVFVSGSWIAVGNNTPVPMPAGLEIVYARCENGIFAAPCSQGLFIMRGPNYGTFYVTSLPFLPQNIEICTEILNGGIFEPHLFCSSNNTIVYFSLAHEIPTNLNTHTVEKSFVTSAVKQNNCVHALFSCGLLMQITSRCMTKIDVIEKNCGLLWVDTKHVIYQRENFEIVILQFGVVVACFPLANVCRAVLEGGFSFFFLESTLDAGPMLSQFEYASMTRLDSIFAEQLADSRSVVDNECSHSNKNFLLYRGGIYHFR